MLLQQVRSTAIMVFANTKLFVCNNTKRYELELYFSPIYNTLEDDHRELILQFPPKVFRTSNREEDNMTREGKIINKTIEEIHLASSVSKICTEDGTSFRSYNLDTENALTFFVALHLILSPDLPAERATSNL